MSVYELDHDRSVSHGERSASMRNACKVYLTSSELVWQAASQRSNSDAVSAAMKSQAHCGTETHA